MIDAFGHRASFRLCAAGRSWLSPRRGNSIQPRATPWVRSQIIPKPLKGRFNPKRVVRALVQVWGPTHTPLICANAHESIDLDHAPNATKQSSISLRRPGAYIRPKRCHPALSARDRGRMVFHTWVGPVAADPARFSGPVPLEKSRRHTRRQPTGNRPRILDSHWAQTMNLPMPWFQPAYCRQQSRSSHPVGISKHVFYDRIAVTTLSNTRSVRFPGVMKVRCVLLPKNTESSSLSTSWGTAPNQLCADRVRMIILSCCRALATRSKVYCCDGRRMCACANRVERYGKNSTEQIPRDS